MPNYVDGFVFPIPRSKLRAYRELSDAAAQIWKEHGAIEYSEFVGDDMHLEGTRSFPDLVNTTEEEVIIFGWVVFESREMRDLANEKVASDPRMPELMSASDTGFDPSKMAYGGFHSLSQID